MPTDSPSWAEIRGRTLVPGFRSARGVFRRTLSGPDGAASDVRDTTFLAEFPDRLRVDGPAGDAVWIDDGTQWWHRGSGADPMTWHQPLNRGPAEYGLGHAGALVGSVPWIDGALRSGRFETPTEPGRAVTVAGRSCWEFTLEPGPAVVAFDDATGIAVRVDISGDGCAELVEFAPDVDLPAGAFGWAGPTAAPHRHARSIEENPEDPAPRDTELFEGAYMMTSGYSPLDDDAGTSPVGDSVDVPTPRWWPVPIGVHPYDGDPATGAWVASVRHGEYTSLGRWPAGGAVPDGLESPGRGHVHRWRHGSWEWGLAAFDPLDPEFLAALVTATEFAP